MKLQNRRTFLKRSSQALSALFVQSLASGLPASFLLNPTQVHAQSSDQLRKTLILSTSRRGDPMNINCPGSYRQSVENNPILESATGTFGTSEAQAARVWCDLPVALRNRLGFFHYAPRSAAHPEYLDAMAFHGNLNGRGGNGSEIFPSAIAQMTYQQGLYLQEEPVRLCDTDLTFESQPIQQVKPVDLKALFDPADPALVDLRSVRDSVLDSLYADMRVNGNRAQRNFVDRYALSREQSRQLSMNLGQYLEGIPNDEEDLNNAQDQIIAAVALARIGVSPVITVNIPFGGDNHQDSDLQMEADQTTSGVQLIGELWNMLNVAQLEDQVSFAAMNVFGRRSTRNSRGGRDHNQHHAVMVGFGSGVQGGVYGRMTADGQAQDINGITQERTLEAAGASMMRAFGCEEADITLRVPNGQIHLPFIQS